MRVLRCTAGVALTVALVPSLMTATPVTASVSGITAPPHLGPSWVLAKAGAPSGVAIDRAGNATVVWRSRRWPDGTIYAARRPAGGRWGRPVALGRGLEPRVAADRRGTVTVVWSRYRPGYTVGVMAARRPVGGPWGRAVPLSDDKRAHYDLADDGEGTFGAGSVGLAVSPGGAVAVTWQWGSYDRDRPYRVQAVYRPAGGRWGRTARLTPANWSSLVDSGIDADGNAVVTFVTGDPNRVDTPVLSARRRVIGRGWTSPVTLLRGGSDAGVLTVDPAGNTVVISSRAGRALAFRRPVNGTWGPPQVISPAGVTVYPADAVVDDGGTVTATWVRGNYRIDAVRRPVHGRWGAPVQLAVPSQYNRVGTMAVNGSGAIFVTWDHGEPGPRGAYRPAGGRWVNAFQVDVDDVPQTAMYPGGDALLVWGRYDGGESVMVRRLRAS